MRNRSVHGGRHELGQNFLTHKPTIATIVRLVRATQGSILEIGAGDGALTAPLAALRRPLLAIDIDEHRVARLQRRLPAVEIQRRDATRTPLDRPVIVGNLPFHLTTPLLRRLLNTGSWRDAVVLTQWEVARKRAGVGGATMMTAQAAPWFGFKLHTRVPAHGFTPQPSVDGGVLSIRRRGDPLVPGADRSAYQRFVQAVFTGRGRGLAAILRVTTSSGGGAVKGALRRAVVAESALPRDLTPEQWAELWNTLASRGG